MTTRAEMVVRTRSSLVRAALDLLARQTYDETSIGDITAAAGVTKGAFYHHYADKEELVLSIQQDLLDQAIDASAVVVAQRMSPSEELRALLALHVRMVLEHRQALSVSLTERRSPGPERWAVIRAKRDRIEAFVVDCLVRGRESGDFGVAGPPRLLAYTLLGMCYWGNVWFRPDGPWSVEQIVDTIAAVALDGVRG